MSKYAPIWAEPISAKMSLAPHAGLSSPVFMSIVVL